MAETAITSNNIFYSFPEKMGVSRRCGDDFCIDLLITRFRRLFRCDGPRAIKAALSFRTVTVTTIAHIDFIKQNGTTPLGRSL